MAPDLGLPPLANEIQIQWRLRRLFEKNRVLTGTRKTIKMLKMGYKVRDLAMFWDFGKLNVQLVARHFQTRSRRRQAPSGCIREVFKDDSGEEGKRELEAGHERGMGALSSLHSSFRYLIVDVRPGKCVSAKSQSSQVAFSHLPSTIRHFRVSIHNRTISPESSALVNARGRRGCTDNAGCTTCRKTSPSNPSSKRTSIEN